ncbi:Hint domain-containing protein [Lichenicola sp.]|uniref:Hint domain-containing protein n=1 Tax=Lichenicola sp. TaxID=2804529 RepID=UPI003B00313D
MVNTPNYWNGNAGDSLWDDAGNWSAGVPTSGSGDISITLEGTVDVIIQATDPTYTLRSLTLGSSSGSANLIDGSSLTVSTSLTMAGSSSFLVTQSGTANFGSLDLGSASTIIDHGALNIGGAITGNGTIAIDGGELFTDTVGGNNLYTLTNGGVITLTNDVSSTGTINFGDASANTMDLVFATSIYSGAITGFGTGSNVIDLESLAYKSSYTFSYTGSSIVINDGNSTVFVLTDINNPGALVLKSDGAKGTELMTCFLRGTLIATPAGDVAVEDLCVGDMVSVLEDGERVGRPIAWTGCGRMDASRLAHADEAFPVRIRKDAFASGLPARDLLVTPEHCILTAAGLVPARMLVNGASILIDRSIPDYEFFHVELDTHAILLAEDLATESYLDTGNRGLFEGGRAHANVLRGPTMAAPLAVSRALVEPIWQMLVDRACDLGFEGPGIATALTSQPDLRLLLEDGSELGCHWTDGHAHMFRIPASGRAVRLLSRSAIPARIIGPFVDDRRTLGVSVEKLVFWTGLVETTLKAADLALDGWHAAEDGRRWTNGAAALDMPTMEKASYLDVHIASTAQYLELVAA